MKDVIQRYGDCEDRGDYRSRLLFTGSQGLKVDMVLFGYVKAYTPKGCFVTVGNGTDIRIDTNELTDQYPRSEDAYRKNKIILLRITQAKNSKSGDSLFFQGSSRQSIVKSGYPINDEVMMVGLTVRGSIMGYSKGKALVRIHGSKYTAIISPRDVTDSDTAASIEKLLPIGGVLTAKVIEFKSNEGKTLIRLSTLSKYEKKYAGVEFQPEIDQRASQLWTQWKQAEMQEQTIQELTQPQQTIIEQQNDQDGSDNQYARISAMLGHKKQNKPVIEQQQKEEQEEEEEEEQEEQEYADKLEEEQAESDEQGQGNGNEANDKPQAQVQIPRVSLAQFEAPPHPPSFYLNLVTANPSVEAYLMYIASLLPTSTPEQIRNQFARAISAMQKLSQKDDLWIGWLNTELILGGLPQTVKRAMEYDVGLKVYNRIVEIFFEQGKWQLGLEFLAKLARKFRKNSESYTYIFKALLKVPAEEETGARFTFENLLRKAKLELGTQETVSVQTQLAIALFSHPEKQE